MFHSTCVDIIIPWIMRNYVQIAMQKWNKMQWSGMMWDVIDVNWCTYCILYLCMYVFFSEIHTWDVLVKGWTCLQPGRLEVITLTGASCSVIIQFWHATPARNGSTSMRVLACTTAPDKLYQFGIWNQNKMSHYLQPWLLYNQPSRAVVTVTPEIVR